MRGRSIRIVYRIQSTGSGHLPRFLGLKPFFNRDCHELLVLASGYEDPPEYFVKAIPNCRYTRLRRISYMGDDCGGISKRRTLCAFARHLLELLAGFWRAQALIAEFDPEVVISDFDPISGSVFVAPAIPKLGLSHQNAFMIPGMYHPREMCTQRSSSRGQYCTHSRTGSATRWAATSTRPTTCASRRSSGPPSAMLSPRTAGTSWSTTRCLASSTNSGNMRLTIPTAGSSSTATQGRKTQETSTSSRTAASSPTTLPERRPTWERRGFTASGRPSTWVGRLPCAP